MTTAAVPLMHRLLGLFRSLAPQGRGLAGDAGASRGASIAWAEGVRLRTEGTGGVQARRGGRMGWLGVAEELEADAVFWLLA